MKTVSQLDVTLSQVAFLLEQQRYDEALPILGYLMKANPDDRETRMYRQLVVRILVLRHGLSQPARESKRSDRFSRLLTKFAFPSRRRKGTEAAGYDDADPVSIGSQNLQLPSELEAPTQNVDQLTTRNNDLLEETESLIRKLATSEKAGEKLQRLHQVAEREIQYLRAANETMQKERATIEQQLQASETRLAELSRHYDETVARSSNLEVELGELKNQLQSSQTALAEVQAERSRLENVQVEKQRLEQEIESLRSSLALSRAQLTEAAKHNQEIGAQYAQLQEEVFELQKQLAESQVRAREVELLQAQLTEVHSREMTLQSEQQSLARQITGLEQDLSDSHADLRELAASRQRLAAMRAENQRLHIEISRLQEQLAGREELERQVSGLREELEELRSASPIDAPAATSTGRELIRLPGQPAVIHPLSRHFRTQGKRKLRLAMIPALVVLAIASTISVGLFRSSREITSSPTETTAKTQLISEDAPVPPPVVAIPTSRAAAIEVDKKKVFKPAPRTKPSPQVVGLFEVTRSASVYRAPSEISQAVARVEPGMKVTVVGSRDGWLEIRSKYGRPPGFVRQEAVRIEQNLG